MPENWCHILSKQKWISGWQPRWWSLPASMAMQSARSMANPLSATPQSYALPRWERVSAITVPSRCRHRRSHRRDITATTTLVVSLKHVFLITDGICTSYCVGRHGVRVVYNAQGPQSNVSTVASITRATKFTLLP